jgi:hypothetical protein
MVFFLLAQFKVKDAYPYIVKYITVLEHDYFDQTSAFISSDLKKILASCFDGNFQLLESTILNQDIDEDVRIAFLMSL